MDGASQIPRTAGLIWTSRCALVGSVVLSFAVLGAKRGQPMSAPTPDSRVAAATTTDQAPDHRSLELANRPLTLDTAELAAPVIRPASARLPELLKNASTDDTADDDAQPASAHLAAATPLIAAPTMQRTRTIWMTVTAYCGCTKCCGASAHGITASGRHISYNGGLFVAADTTLLPFNTQLIVPGYAHGQAVEVIDRGSAIRGHHLDVYFPTHEQAKAWGTRWLAVTVME